MDHPPFPRIHTRLALGLALAATFLWGSAALPMTSARVARVAAQNKPPETYKRVATWPALPQHPRPAGEFTAAAGIDVAADGTVFAVDRAESTVHVLSATGAPLRLVGRPGTDLGELDGPNDVAVADGRLYVTDTGNGRVQVFDAANGRFLAVWTNLGRPWGIAVGKDRAYVSDADAPRISVLDLAGVVQTTWGPGAAVGGQDLRAARGMDVAADDRLFVADPVGRKVVVLKASGQQDMTYERNNDPNFQPMDVAAEGTTVYAVAWRELYVSQHVLGFDMWRQHDHIGGQAMALGPGDGVVVTIQDTQSIFSGVAYHPFRDNLDYGIQHWGTVPVPLGSLAGPRRLASRPDGGVLLLDGNPRVQRWSAAGQPEGQLRSDETTDVAAAAGSDLYIIQPRGVRRVAADGKLVWSWRTTDGGSWLGAGASGVPGPSGAGGALADHVRVVDDGLGQLVDIDASGKASTYSLAGLLVDIAVGGQYLFVADRADSGALRLLSANGTEVHRWAFPGRVTRVAAMRDGTAFFALTSDGWVWKYDANGNLRAAWDGGLEGSPVDLDVDPNGRVLVADGTGNRVFVWAPDAVGSSAVPPSPDDRCDLMPEKTAQPARVRVGEAVTVTLSVDGDCPAETLPLDVVLVIDRSGSMLGPKLAAAKAAAIAFTEEMDFRRVQLAMVTFSTSATVVQQLTADPHAVVRAVASLEATGYTDIGAGIRTAAGELASTRGRAGAQKVIVLMTDGRPSTDTTLAEAAAARAAGVTLYTIGLGSDLDAALLRLVAGADDRYFDAPSEAGLSRVFTRIARRLVTGVLLRAIEVTDVIPANMDYVPNSADPGATWDGPSRTLLWQLTNVTFSGLRLTYQLIPRQAGFWPTNVRATGDYRDGVGFGGGVGFPVPRVSVLGNQAAYLPFLLQNRCPEQRFDFVLAIDTSSSMLESTAAGGQTKLDAARLAAAHFLDYLRLPGDQAAVVAFNTNATTVQSLTDDLAALRGALDRLPQESGTRIDRGLAEAKAQLSGPRHRPQNLPVVILLTDGRPTDGTTDAVLARAGELRKAGVALFTIGLGADVDGGLLIDVAGEAGRYSYAPDQLSLGGIYRAIALTVPCR